MKKIISERMTVEVESDFVVILLGVRINKPWLLHVWIPVVIDMLRLLSELRHCPAPGYLGQSFGFPMVALYWESFDALEQYATASNYAHKNAWGSLNRRVRSGRAIIGFWHETYLVQSNRFEAIYSGMPPNGVGEFGRLTKLAANKERARGRLGSMH